MPTLNKTYLFIYLTLKMQTSAFRDLTLKIQTSV